MDSHVSIPVPTDSPPVPTDARPLARIPMEVPVPKAAPVPICSVAPPPGSSSPGAHPFSVGLGEPAQLPLGLGEVQQDDCGERREPLVG